MVSTTIFQLYHVFMIGVLLTTTFERKIVFMLYALSLSFYLLKLGNFPKNVIHRIK